MTVKELKEKLAQFHESLTVKVRCEYTTNSSWELVEANPDVVMLTRTDKDNEPFVVIERRLGK